MIKNFSFISLILCLSAQSLLAQITGVTLLNAKPVCFEKTEFAISLNAKWDNPYLQQDVALDMTFTAPSGKVLRLPCYYESGRSGSTSFWKARFAPQEKGSYSYTARLTVKGIEVYRSESQSFVSSASNQNGFLHTKNNWVLQFDNKKIFRGIGENIAWESRANDDSKFFKALNENPKYNYEYMLRSLAANGGNFFRTWIAPFNLPIDWEKGFNSNRYEASDQYFNPSAIAKMDRLVDLCDSLHLYMMLTLGTGGSSVGAGGFSPNPADFFVNPKSKERYKNRLRYFIARWGYSTSIGMWELFNEVDNVQFSNKDKPINPDTIVLWHEEMSAFIKHTDPYGHPVTTSISHRDIKGLNSLPYIDINQKHIYRNTAAIPGAIGSYEATYGKPYVIGEYSYEWDWSKNFNDFAEQMDSDYKRGLWYGLFSPTPVLPMSWWWEYFNSRGTDSYLIRVRLIMNDMLKAGNGNFEQLEVRMRDTTVIKYAVKCGSKVYVYVFNPGLSNRISNISICAEFKRYKVVAYDCNTGTYKKLGHRRQTIADPIVNNWTLPANTDVVFILTKS